MTWEPEVAELQHRLGLARGMGGPEGIARQRKRGKLTVRERIDLFADPGTFRQFGALRGNGVYDEHGDLASFTPRGQVDGTCLIGGRKVVLMAGDFTVQGGAYEHSGGLGEEMGASERSLEWRLPHVRLIDASGGSVRSVETLGRTYLPDANSFVHTDVALLDAVPVASVVLGAPHLARTLERDGREHLAGVPRWPACGQGRPRHRHHEGGPRGPADPRPQERCGGQRCRNRGRSPRPVPPVPVVPSVERSRTPTARTAARRSGTT